jgi:hypothetical protein
MNRAALTVGMLLLLVCSPLRAQQDAAPGRRVGIIGLDTSHSPAFVRALNDPDAGPELGGYRVVAAYPYGSRTIESSSRRIPGYTRDVQALGVEIVLSIEALLGRVDVVLLNTNDGRLHLEQALQVFRAGKPVFIDKPLAASLADAIAIFQAAKRHGVPMFSASSLRFKPDMQAVRNGSVGRVLGADAYSPAHLESTHPDLVWYGIHGVETLFTVMGTGCETVSRAHVADADVVTCTWKDGRIGTVRGLRSGKLDYGGTVFGSDSIAVLGRAGGYEELLREIVRFFDTGVAPVTPEETLEIFAFMEAAEESKRRDGAPVGTAEVMRRAREKARLRPSLN